MSSEHEKRKAKVKHELESGLKGWHPIHWIIARTMHRWMQVYHRRYHMIGYDQIDWSKPIIFAPTHQNAFMDAVAIIAPTRYVPDRYIYALARAGAFGTKLVRWFLSTIHMMPIFRPRDKVDIRASNEAVFEICQDLLAKDHCLLIHPEGNCIVEKRVGPLRKGMARIAFGTVERHGFDIDLQVIPVSIYFRKLLKARHGVTLKFGAPVAIADYREAYQDNPARAIKMVTDDLYARLKRVHVHVAEREDLDLAEKAFDVADIIYGHPAGEEQFRLHKQLAESINGMAGDQKAALSQQVDQYHNTVSAVAGDYRFMPSGKPSIGKVLFSLVGQLLLLPVWLFGVIHNGWLWAIITRLADSKIGELQFISSARLLLGYLLFPILHLIYCFSARAISGSWAIALGYLAAVMISGAWSFWAYDWFRKTRAAIRYRTSMRPEQRADLQRTEEEIRILLGSQRA